MKTHTALIDFLASQASVSQITAPINHIICQSGDACQHLIFITQGTVKVYRPAEDGRCITLYHIGENESCILTASCIINGNSFPAIAETETEVIGYAIPANKVQTWMHSENIWQQYLFNLLSQRMASLIELVNSLAFQQLDHRLINWLLCHAKRNHSIQIKTTHQHIAEELASSREVISRLLKEFEREQWIQLKRGTIEIIQLNKLQQIANNENVM